MGLSVWHLILLLGIVVIFFGPSRLPKVGQSLGETIRQFKKAMNDGADDVEAEKLTSSQSSTQETTKNKDTNHV